MTKKELFEILENCPDDAEIYIDMCDDHNFENDTNWLSNIREPIPDIKYVKDNKIVKRPSRITEGSEKVIIL